MVNGHIENPVGRDGCRSHSRLNFPRQLKEKWLRWITQPLSAIWQHTMILSEFWQLGMAALGFRICKRIFPVFWLVSKFHPFHCTYNFTHSGMHTGNHGMVYGVHLFFPWISIGIFGETDITFMILGLESTNLYSIKPFSNIQPFAFRSDELMIFSYFCSCPVSLGIYLGKHVLDTA